MKRNKIRYQSKPIRRILITLNGNIYLQYVDEEQIAGAVKGDLMLFPQVEALHTTRQGDYESTGFSGYFKVDVSDGRDWRPVIITDIFPDHENHFSKKERPIDTYRLCAELLRGMQGKNLIRTYREHYTPDEG